MTGCMMTGRISGLFLTASQVLTAGQAFTASKTLTTSLVLTASLAFSTLAYGQSDDTIGFAIGDYSLAMPADSIQHQSLQNLSLTTTYRDDSSISVSIVPRADFEERTAIPASEYLKDLYGEQAPSSSISQVLRNRNTRDLVDKQIQEKGNLTYYILTFPEHQVVYIADNYQPEYYVTIEARNRPLEPMIQSFQGGKTGSSSITGELGGR